MSNAPVDRRIPELQTEPPLQFFESLLSLAAPGNNALARHDAEAHHSIARTLGEIFPHGNAAR